MKTIFHVFSSLEEYAIKSKTVEGELTSYGKEAIAKQLMLSTSDELEIDPSTLKAVECNSSGIVLKHYFLGDK